MKDKIKHIIYDFKAIKSSLYRLEGLIVDDEEFEYQVRKMQRDIIDNYEYLESICQTK